MCLRLRRPMCGNGCAIPSDSPDMAKQVKKENYHLYVTLKNGDAVVERVSCKVYLPKRFSDPFFLQFCPSNDQVDIINEAILPIYSLQGEIKDLSGSISTKIQADEVWSTTGIASRYWGSELIEVSPLTSKPLNLEVINFLSPRDSENKSHGRFWITPNNLLAPAGSIMRSYTGAVEVKTVWQQEFTLCNGVHLEFKNRYLYEELGDSEFLTFTELVGEFEIGDEAVNSARINELRHDLDDFLLLVSLASRERCVCHGWDIVNSKICLEFYRREIVIPKVKKRRGRRGDELIDLADCRDFINTAYKNFIGFEGKESIRQAIYAAVPRESVTTEKRFMALYAAVETLVLAYRKKHGLEQVFSSKEWKRFSCDLRQWLQGHESLAQNPEKYQLIQSKLGDLNRISFATAFNAFCENYSVDVADLWPVTGNAGGLSLSSIRNRIVHGETFDREKHQALFTATLHLQLVVERMLLAVLDWPIDRSDISKKKVSTYVPYEEMQSHRELITRKRQT